MSDTGPPTPRHSTAAVALIRQDWGDGPRWLVQWNPRWGAYNLVAGHRHDEESFRECLVRELEEELGLEEHRDYQVVHGPPISLEFDAWSERTRAQTHYEMELYEVKLTPETERRVGEIPNNRWVSEAEIRDGRCADGRPISVTMQRLVDAASS